MKIVVAGAGGMLGRKLLDVLSGDHEVVGLARRADAEMRGLDLLDRDAVDQALEELAPEIVVNCAAFTAVDDCEAKADEAYRGNAIAPENLAQACLRHGAALFHVSTDYVFDGNKGSAYDEFDEPCPQSVYGRSKLAGEMAVQRSGVAHWIGRVQWLYGEHGGNFADTILPFVDKAALGLSPTPALLGVGYILGRRIGTIMVGGGLLSWMVIIPVIAWQFADTVIGPEEQQRVALIG